MAASSTPGMALSSAQWRRIRTVLAGRLSTAREDIFVDIEHCCPRRVWLEVDLSGFREKGSPQSVESILDALGLLCVQIESLRLDRAQYAAFWRRVHESKMFLHEHFVGASTYDYQSWEDDDSEDEDDSERDSSDHSVEDIRVGTTDEEHGLDASDSDPDDSDDGDDDAGEHGDGHVTEETSTILQDKYGMESAGPDHDVEADDAYANENDDDDDDDDGVDEVTQRKADESIRSSDVHRCTFHHGVYVKLFWSYKPLCSAFAPAIQKFLNAPLSKYADRLKGIAKQRVRPIKVAIWFTDASLDATAIASIGTCLAITSTAASEPTLCHANCLKQLSIHRNVLRRREVKALSSILANSSCCVDELSLESVIPRQQTRKSSPPGTQPSRSSWSACSMPD